MVATGGVALITGGAGVIGLATAERLTGQGFALHLVDQNTEALELARIEAAGARFQVDIPALPRGRAGDAPAKVWSDRRTVVDHRLKPSKAALAVA